jgi:hypothetical protein
LPHPLAPTGHILVNFVNSNSSFVPPWHPLVIFWSTWPNRIAITSPLASDLKQNGQECGVQLFTKSLLTHQIVSATANAASYFKAYILLKRCYIQRRYYYSFDKVDYHIFLLISDQSEIIHVFFYLALDDFFFDEF